MIVEAIGASLIVGSEVAFLLSHLSGRIKAKPRIENGFDVLGIEAGSVAIRHSWFAPAFTAVIEAKQMSHFMESDGLEIGDGLSRYKEVLVVEFNHSHIKIFARLSRHGTLGGDRHC